MEAKGREEIRISDNSDDDDDNIPDVTTCQVNIKVLKELVNVVC